MPPHLLTSFANALLIGKILTCCPVKIPVRISEEDKTFGYTGVLEDINKSIKSTARTITKSKLSDKIRSTEILRKANLKCLNEAVASVVAITVWKAKQSMNPLGCRLFKEKTSVKRTRFAESDKIHPPVPGYPNLATNIMARIWNSVPELRNAKTLGAARVISRKWAKTIPI